MKNIRFYAFWAADSLKGGKVCKHLKDVQAAFDSDADTQRRTETILNYAAANVGFYRGFTTPDLQQFPVVTKHQITSEQDRFIADRYKDKLSQLRSMATSGSTGMPFRVYQDADKVRRNKADMLFFYARGGYSIGGRMYYLRIWNALNRKSRLQLLLENFRMADSSSIGPEGAEHFVQMLREDRSRKWMLGYASSFTSLMAHLEGRNLTDLGMQAIFTGSEALPQPVKEQMLQAFGCPVMSRYSNQENGMLAQQPPDADYFELNEGSYGFEFLKLDSDAPAQEGEVSRIVITDYYNRAMPIIRYDTGDLGVFRFVDRNGRRVRVIERIEGRAFDFLYKCDGERLSPHAVGNMMWRYQGVAHFQIVQEALDHLRFSVVLKPGGEDPREAVLSGLLNVFGSEVRIDYQIVDNIPLTAGGKHRCIVSKL